MFLNEQLIKALKQGDAVEFGKITVGALQLRQLLTLMPYPDSLVRANGRLEFETVQRIGRQVNGVRKFSFRKPKHDYNFFAVRLGAWLPDTPAKRISMKTVVLKPRTSIVG